MKIILVRHGESIANAKGERQGQRNDTSLSRLGLKQVKKVAKRLKKEKIEAIYSSDLKRAYETAKEIAKFHKVKIIKDKRLREFDSGDLINKKDYENFWDNYKERESKRLRVERWAVKAPEGESEKDHLDRVRNFIKEVKPKHKGTIIIVAHGGTNKMFFGAIGHVPKQKMYEIPQSNTGVNLIEINENKHKVEAINDTSHLGPYIKNLRKIRKIWIKIKKKLRNNL